MSQLSFWTTPAPDVYGLQETHVPSARGKLCRVAAQAMQKHIDAKHESANRMLSKPPTRKRLADATAIRNTANRLEQIQRTLLELAERHDKGSVDTALAGFVSAAAIERALWKEPADSALHQLFESMGHAARKQDQILQRVQQAALMRIPGYFPTPESLSDQLVSLAQLQPGLKILEPSAGSGNLIDAARRHCKHLKIFFCEVNLVLQDILRDKYEGGEDVHFLGRDFLEIESYRPGERFDRVLMNPPFEHGQDIDHVLQSHSMLTNNGILVAVMSTGAFSRSDKKATWFRDFLQTEKALVRDVPANAFKASGTNVQSKLVCLHKI